MKRILAPALIVIEARLPATELFSKHPILLAKIFNDLQLALVHPCSHATTPDMSQIFALLDCKASAFPYHSRASVVTFRQACTQERPLSTFPHSISARVVVGRRPE